MKRVTGIGGIFFKAKDPAALGAWYRDHLGIALEDWGGAVFQWANEDNPAGVGTTVWSPLKDDTDYFTSGRASFMINYRVDDLHALLAALCSEGCQVDDMVEESEYGKFGWVTIPKATSSNCGKPPMGVEPRRSMS